MEPTGMQDKNPKYILSDHRLMEEAYQLRATDVSNNNVEGYFYAVNHPSGLSEALIRIKGGIADGMCHAHRQQDSSSGWGISAPTFSLPANDSVAGSFYHGNTLYVIVKRAASGSPWLTSYSEGKWQQARIPGLGATPGLETCEVREDNRGLPWFFCNFKVGAKYQSAFWYVHPNGKDWVYKRMAGEGSQISNGLHLEISQRQGRLTTGTQLSGNYNIFDYSFQHDNEPVDAGIGGRYGLGEGTVMGIQRFDKNGGDPLLDFFQMDRGQLFYNYRLPRSAFFSREPMDGGPARFSSVRFTDVAGKCVVLALDEKHRLWVRRERERSSHRIVWDNWTCIGEEFKAIAVAPKMAAELEIFGIDEKYQLQHMYQGPDSVWYKERISQPSPGDSKLVKSRAYVTELTVTDGHGHAAAGKIVHLSATRYTEVVSGNLAYHLDAKSKAILKTDEAGKLRFSTKAEDIVAPTFKVHVPELMGEQAVAVRPDVHNFRKMGADEVNGDLLVEKGLISDGLKDKKEDIAKALREASKLALKKPDMGDSDFVEGLPEWKRRTPYLHGLEVFANADFHSYQCMPDFHHHSKGWLLDLSPGEGGGFRFLEEDEIASMVEEMSIIDIVRGVGDFFRSIWNRAGEISKFIVDNLGRVMVEIGGAIYRVVAETVQHIGNFLELMFKKIAKVVGDAIGKVLDWLKELLGWDHILRTQKVMKHLALGLFTSFDHTLAWAQENLDKNFDRINARMRAEFDKAIESLEGSPDFQSLQGIANQAEGHPMMGANPLLPSAMEKTSSGLQAQMNYVSSKAGDHYKTQEEDLLADAFSVDLIGRIKSFASRFKKDVVDTVGKDVEELINDLMKLVDNPADFLNKGLVLFLKLIRTLMSGILNVVKVLLIELVGLMRDILKAVVGALQAKIEIPVLTALYKEIAGDDLTLLSLFTLMAAAPVTLLYRLSGMGTLLRKVEAPFKDDAEVDRLIGRTDLWPKLDADGQPIASQSPRDPALDIVLPSIAALLELPKGLTGILKSASDRKNNDLPTPGPSNPFTKYVNVSDWIMEILVQGTGAPFKSFRGTQPHDYIATIAWFGDFLPISANALGCLGANLPLGSDLGGVLAVLAAVPNWILAVSKIIQKENVFSILDSFASPLHGLTGFLVRDMKTDPKFIAFLLGTGLNVVFTLGKVGVKGGAVILDNIPKNKLEMA